MSYKLWKAAAKALYLVYFHLQMIPTKSILTDRLLDRAEDKLLLWSQRCMARAYGFKVPR